MRDRIPASRNVDKDDGVYDAFLGVYWFTTDAQCLDRVNPGLDVLLIVLTLPVTQRVGDHIENILQAEETIDGVFAHNDEMILGAIEAATAAGRAADIVFVGFDAVDDAVAAVQAGTLAATVAQQPALMGDLGVMTAAAYLGGEEVTEYIPVDLALVTAE